MKERLPAAMISVVWGLTPVVGEDDLCEPIDLLHADAGVQTDVALLVPLEGVEEDFAVAAARDSASLSMIRL